jgi:hypothetical protein
MRKRRPVSPLADKHVVPVQRAGAQAHGHPPVRLDRVGDVGRPEIARRAELVKDDGVDDSSFDIGLTIRPAVTIRRAASPDKDVWSVSRDVNSSAVVGPQIV